MSTLRIESLGADHEVVDYIDLRGEVNAERIVRARRVLEAKEAQRLGDISMIDSVRIELACEEV